MEHSSRLFSVRSYALAFAVALSPVFFQTAYTCERGDTYLLTLNFGAPEGSSIPFNPNLRDYAVSTSADTVFVRVKTRDPGSVATYQWDVPGMPPDSGCIGVCGEPGGGDVTLTIPPDQSTLRIAVRSPENAVGYYTIDVNHVPRFPCTEAGINAAIAVGTGPHVFDCNGPETVLADNEIVINNSVWLDGEGKLTVDGMGAHRVFSVDQGVTAWLARMTVTGGMTTENGGGIRNQGALTLASNTVSGNHAPGLHGVDSGHGAGIFNSGALVVNDSVISSNSPGGYVSIGYGCNGGGIYNAVSGEVTLNNTTVSNNEAGTYCAGGGIYSEGVALTLNDSRVIDNQAVGEGNWGGGIAHEGGPLTLSRSTVSGNVTWEGGGIYVGGNTTIVDSTISGNQAVLYDGGGISHYGGNLTVINSTVSGNQAGAYFPTDGKGGGIVSYGTVILVHSTLSGNIALVEGDAIYADSVLFQSSIVDGTCSISGVVTSGGYNLDTGNSCLPGGGTDQVNVTELNLGPLQDNGGPTLTHAPLANSIAIDQIPEAACLDHSRRTADRRPTRHLATARSALRCRCGRV